MHTENHHRLALIGLVVALLLTLLALLVLPARTGARTWHHRDAALSATPPLTVNGTVPAASPPRAG